MTISYIFLLCVMGHLETNVKELEIVKLFLEIILQCWNDGETARILLRNSPKIIMKPLRKS